MTCIMMAIEKSEVLTQVVSQASMGVKNIVDPQSQLTYDTQQANHVTMMIPNDAKESEHHQSYEFFL